MKSYLLAAVALAAFAPAAHAQTAQSAGRIGQMNGACGQPLALSYSLAMPVDQVAAAPLDGAFQRAEPFYLEFTLAAAGRVVLATRTEDGSVDPFLTLYDTRGTTLASDDDAAGNLNAMLDLTLEPGTYCAQVRPVSASDARQSVTLHLATGAAADELASQVVTTAAPAELCTDPALTAEFDRMFEPGGGTSSQQISVDPGSRRDWRLTVTEEMDLQIDAASGQFDTTLMLVDDAGNMVAENDDAFSQNTDSRIVLRAQPGTYCLSLSGYEGGSGLAEVTVTDTPEAPIAGPIEEACTNPAMTTDLGMSLAPGLGTYSVSGQLSPGSRSDWRFDVSGEVLLQFDAKSDDFDTLLSLLDGSGQLLEQNDDEANSVNSRITRTLGPGSYCLAVASFGGGGGNFELSATDTPSADSGPTSTDASFCAMPESTAALGTDIAPGLGTLSVPAKLAGAALQDFTMNVAAETALRLEARSADFDTVLRLATADGTVLAENDDGPSGTDSSFDYTLAPGAYCLRLESFGGGEGAAELTLSERDAAAVSADAVAQGEAIPAAGSGVEIEELGALADRLETSRLSEDPTKWVAFELDAEGGVRIDAISLGGSFTLRLFTEAGEVVAESESYGGLSPARIEQTLPAGRYLLAVALDPFVESRLRNVVISRTGG